MSLLDVRVRRPMALLVGFLDFTLFQKNALRKSDSEVAESLNDYYLLIDKKISEAGGTVIKFIGDAALVAFDEKHVDDGVEACLELKEHLDAWLPRNGWRGSTLVVKMHYGDVICGPFGPLGHVDILGNVVNTTARLEGNGVALSAEAFRKLAPRTRKRFQKCTPAATYIRVEDDEG